MRVFFRWLVLFVVLAGFLFSVSGWAVGRYLEPRLEHQLSELFGMPVEIEGLYAHPYPGCVRARRLTFHHNPPYDARPHLEARGVRFDIDFLALQNQQVLIRGLVLEEPYYFIDRKLIDGQGRTSVSTWVKHMKGRNNKEEPEGQKQDKREGDSWNVSIRSIELRDTTLVIQDDTSTEGKRRFVFQDMNATLRNFRWPTEDPSRLTQEVVIEGLFGEYEPSPFWIRGAANFATSRVSFDLDGRIPNGNFAEHKVLWEGLPIEIVKGRYSMDVHAVCHLRDLEARNRLLLKGIKVKAGPKASDKIWGFPLKASIAFLEDQKAVSLLIPIRGRINDPDFQYDKAFQKAFQEALGAKTQAGLQQIKGSAQRLASEAQGIVTETPSRVMGGLGKIAGAVQEMGAKAAER